MSIRRLVFIILTGCVLCVEEIETMYNSEDP
jgi:hypothetical protein